jgi:hypothetical protein
MLAIFMFIISMVAIATKGFYYHFVMHTDITDQHVIDEFHLFGIWQDEPWKTFGIDCS